MSFRFLKKKDGTKILQYKDMATLEYKDVPMVEEESNVGRIIKEIKKAEENNGFLTILLSKQFHECLNMEHHGLLFPKLGDFVTLLGHRVYVVGIMECDFKILKELKYGRN